MPGCALAAVGRNRFRLNASPEMRGLAVAGRRSLDSVDSDDWHFIFPADVSSRNADDPIGSSLTSIRRLVRVLRLNAQRTQSAAGLSAAQLFVLQQLPKDGNLSLNELAARTLTDRSSVADVVDRLQTQGLVDRAVDLADRRRASVQITASGRRILSRAPEAPTAALIAALKALTPRERTTLARSLVRLNEELGVADEPATMLFAESDERSRPRRRKARVKRRQ